MNSIKQKRKKKSYSPNLEFYHFIVEKKLKNMNLILINVKVLLNLEHYLLHILTYYIQNTQIFLN